MRQRPTLHEVCAAAKVSTFTASRALSGHKGVAAETRKRVLRAAASLGYVANQHARSLKSPNSRVVAVLTANMANQYYGVLVSSLEAVIEGDGYSCVMMDAVLAGAYSQEREDKFVAAVMAQRVAAVVITYNLSRANMQALAAWGAPLIFVDCSAPKGFRHYPSVSSDSYRGSWDLGVHLARLGYTRWAFLGHTKTWNTRQPRQKGFEAAAAASKASVDVIEGSNDSAAAGQALTDYLRSTLRSRWPQVIYASNTVLLHGALDALRRMDVEIPQDMAVVAFDDFEWAHMLDPPITVVDQDIVAIGRTAGSTLLKCLKGPSDERDSDIVVIEPTLRIRESCGQLLFRRRGVLKRNSAA